MKTFFKLSACAIGATFFSAAAMAITIERSVSVQATITDPSATFQVDAVSGTWPVTPSVVNWNESSKTFRNPNKIGFKVKSAQDVTVALSSSAVLVDSQKEIPLNISVTASDTAKGTSAPTVTLLPAVIYESTKNANGEFTTYELGIEASTSGMKDGSGAIITGANATPAGGNYVGSVDLIFESNI